MKYIDFHTHIFPDELASRTIPALEKIGNVRARLDGTLSSLLESMDRAGIEKSVVCSIATRPAQFNSILQWSASIRSDRIIPLPSIHPADQKRLEHLDRISGDGFAGIKLHPYYQEFMVDDESFFPVYERACANGLLIVMHTGYDIGFPRNRIADPPRIAAVMREFPELKLVTTHLGGWQHWDEVAAYILGKPIYMDLSFSLQYLTRDEAVKLLMHHPPEYLLFGSDSPWYDQAEAIALVKTLGVGKDLEEMILRKNALALLGL